MSVCPADFLESAKTLAMDKSEIAKRNALSRSYYAAYHLSKTLFPLARGVAVKGIHKTYIDFLKNHSPGSIERKLGLSLSTLYARRIRADYRLDDPIGPTEVALQISATVDLFNKLATAEESATA